MEQEAIRFKQMETIIEQAAHAFALVPITQLKNPNYIWMPSEIALFQMEEAKRLIHNYIQEHWSE